MFKSVDMRKINELKRYKTPILVILSFLLGFMLSTNLTPIDKTCRIEDTDREYNIMKNSKLKNPELIILILSAPRNLNKRNAVRETWLKLATENRAKFKMKHYFVVGSLGLKTDEVLHLSAEQSRYSDILLLPIRDSYANLTLKVAKSFEWLDEQHDYGLGFKYVLKCDDDSFVRLENLIHELIHLELLYLKAELQQVLALIKERESPFLRANAQVNNLNSSQNSLHLYWGYFSGSARVQTAGKWKELNWIACDRYVPYALGGGYLLSKGLVSYIAKNANYLRMYNSEDISVGFWLAPVDNILRIHDTRFDTEWKSRGCRNVYLITHNISINEMKKLYSNVVETNRLCDQDSLDIERRSSYMYDWLQPPSKCCIVVK